MSAARRIAVVGLGLIGGSLGMRIRDRGLARVIGVDVDPQVARRARERGAADETSTDLAAVRDAEIVIIAVPLDRIVSVAREVAEHATRGAILSEVGSVKAPVVAALEGLGRVRYVGGHPMFGTEAQGIHAAASALADGQPYVLTPTASTDPDALERLRRLVLDLGMRPVILSPEVHDRLVAEVSHLPYLVALALRALAQAEAHEVAGPAFRDATRVAQSPTALWREILRQNRADVLAALDRFTGRLGQIREDLERGEVDRVLEATR